jgi:hypothetical protein
MHLLLSPFGSATERGEDVSAAAVLRKRRAFERLHPGYPVWQSEEQQHMASVAKSEHDRLDDLIDNLHKGVVGREAGHLLAVDHFSKHGYSMTDLGKDGDPRPLESQFERFKKFHPQGQRLAAALRDALPDTMEEKKRRCAITSTITSGQQTERAAPLILTTF